MIKTKFLALTTIFIILGMGCNYSEGWVMDYHKPHAQFHAEDIYSKAEKFIGKKVTIKGKILNVENRDDGNHIYLEHNIHCIFPSWHWGGNLKVGETIYIDGILKSIEDDQVFISPALKRDPLATFKPL